MTAYGCQTHKSPFGIIFSLLLCVMISTTLLAGPCPAEIYRWQDDEGVWHFSDGPSSGPATKPAPDTAPTTTDQVEVAPTRPTVNAQDGLLWQIQGGGYAPSYLLGTIHSDDPRVIRLRPAVTKNLNACRHFVMEMEINNNALMQFGANMLMPEGDDLEDLLEADLYAKVVAAMSEYGMPEATVRQLKPWVVMSLLSMPKPTGGIILDMVLYQRASSQGKPTSGLETAEEQLAVFEGLSRKDQITLLKMTIDQAASLPRMFEQLIQAYAADDLGRLASLAEQYNGQSNSAASQRFMRRLNDERNQRMTRRIIPYLNQGNAFIAVGALHLAGPHGLLALLKQNGYRVESVP